MENPKLKLAMQQTIHFAKKTTNFAYPKILYLYIQVVTPVGLTKNINGLLVLIPRQNSRETTTRDQSLSIT